MLRPPLLARARREVVEAVDLELRRVQAVVRVEVVDLHEADVGHRAHPRLRELVRGLVPLHVRHHQDDARPLRRRDHRFRLRHGDAHRLLHQDVLARLGGGDARRGVRPRRADDHRVDVAPHQLAIVGEAPLLRHAVLRADDLEEPRREVREAADRELVVQLAQVGEMLDLRDRAAPDHANLESRHGLPSNR